MTKLLKPSHVLLFALLVTIAFPALAAETTLQQQFGQAGKATITFDASPLQAMTEIPFTISLVDDHGQAVADAGLSISMDMPAMPMPPNNPVAAWDNGAYRGKAIFTMAGAWQVQVKITSAGTEQRVVFDIEQVMMK